MCDCSKLKIWSIRYKDAGMLEKIFEFYIAKETKLMFRNNSFGLTTLKLGLHSQALVVVLSQIHPLPDF